MVLRGIIISNGIGSENSFKNRSEITFDHIIVDKDFEVDLTSYDLLIVPNGADHVAMYRIRDQVQAMLQAGKAVFCFCGWFTDWLPGNRWMHDNTHPTRDVRHHIGHDSHNLLENFPLERLDQNEHGISGWWACGYIESSHPENVLIEDTWGRALVVVDERTTPGLMILTASGPLGDFGTHSDWGFLTELYENFLSLAIEKTSIRDEVKQ